MKPKRKGGAQPNNKLGIKLKDPDVRQEAYKQYCEHIAKGKPKEAWCFEHPKLSCTSKTMEKYIRDNPDEFPPIHKEIARSKGYSAWFERGEKMTDGLQDKCQPAIYQMIMRNMFDWDKENREKSETQEPLVKKLANMWRGKSGKDQEKSEKK